MRSLRAGRNEAHQSARRIRSAWKVSGNRVLVVQRVFGAKRTNLHEKYDAGFFISAVPTLAPGPGGCRAPTKARCSRSRSRRSAAPRSCGTCRSPPRRSPNASSKRAASPTWPTKRRLHPTCRSSQTPGNSTAAQISIRGSVTTNPALFWEPTVGMYVDGVYVGRCRVPSSTSSTSSASKSCAALRALYGRNTLAGAINLVTRKPSGEFGGSATLEAGNYSAAMGKVSLDLPKLGPLSAAVGLRTEKRDGWVKTTPGSSVGELNDRDTRGGRVALNLDLGRNLRVDYRYDESRADQNSRFSQVVRSTVQGDFGFPGIVVSRAADHGQHRRAVVPRRWT